MFEKRSILISVAGLAAATCLAAQASAVSFTPLGDLPGGLTVSDAAAVSADGTTVVGWSDSADGQVAVRWQSGAGLQALPWLTGDLPYARANAVSDDGNVITGSSGQFMPAGGAAPFEVYEAVRWTEAGATVQGLGLHPDPQPTNAPESWTEGLAISGDGAIVVGANFPAGGFRWDETDGFASLFTPTVPYVHRVNDITSSGNTIVGEAITNDPASPLPRQVPQAFRQRDGGAIEFLGVLEGGSNSAAYAVSSDGSIVVGVSASPGVDAAIRWTQADGMVALEDPLGAVFSGVALDVSADGSVIVGTAGAGSDSSAFIWTEATGARPLAVLLQNAGIDLSGWSLRTANGISADGTVVVGGGINPSGDYEGFIAVIPEPSTGILLGVGLAMLARRRR